MYIDLYSPTWSPQAGSARARNAGGQVQPPVVAAGFAELVLLIYVNFRVKPVKPI